MKLWQLQLVIIALVLLAAWGVVLVPQSKAMNDRIRQICSNPSADRIDADACARWLPSQQ